MLWAKRLRDEHVNLVQSLEKLSSTIKDLEASQLALQQEGNTLRETLAVAEQERERHSRIVDERNAALEQEVKFANKQIIRLEEDVAALRRQAPSASKLAAKPAETIPTSQLSSEYVVDL